MRTGVELTGRYRFDEFELSPHRCILERDGQRIALTPKPLHILICLVEHAGQTVSKQQLFAEIWNGAAVEENNLTQYISALRKTLGEKRGENRYIVTDPGRGYRFVAPVARIPETVASDTLLRIAPDVEPPQENGRWPTGALDRWYGPLAVLIILAIGLVAWRWPAGTKSSDVRLAVLPFHDAGQQHDPAIVDGFTEELTRRLSQAWRVPLIGRNSAFQFRWKEGAAGDIGRQLGVEYFVAGSLRSDGNQFYAGARMIRCKDGVEIWRHEYAAPDLTSLEGKVARDLAVQVGALNVAEAVPGIRRAETSNAQAHDFYLRGRYEWYQHTEDSVLRSQALLERSTALDPDYALAYAALADTYGLIGSWNMGSSRVYLPKAEAAARRSVALDPNLAEGYAALGLIENTRWEWSVAEGNLRHALKLNPGMAVAYERLALNYTVHKRFDSALQLLQTAQTLDPLQTFIEYMLGELSFYRRRYDEVLSCAQQLMERRAAEPALNLLVRTYRVQGRTADLERACTAAPKSAPATIECASLHINDRHKLALLGTEKLEGGFVARARAFAYLGDRDEAFGDLEQAYAMRNPDLVSLAIDPAFDNLRTDPRYRPLLERVGLAP